MQKKPLSCGTVWCLLHLLDLLHGSPRTRGPPKVLPMCSRLLGRLPSDETPGVSPPGCALVAVRACLLVPLCCAHPTNFLTRFLPSPVYPTVVPSARHTSSKRVFVLGRLISLCGWNDVIYSSSSHGRKRHKKKTPLRHTKSPNELGVFLVHPSLEGILGIIMDG
jgi:hypothetical protein